MIGSAHCLVMHSFFHSDLHSFLSWACTCYLISEIRNAIFGVFGLLGRSAEFSSSTQRTDVRFAPRSIHLRCHLKSRHWKQTDSLWDGSPPSLRFVTPGAPPDLRVPLGSGRRNRPKGTIKLKAANKTSCSWRTNILINAARKGKI